MKKKTSPNVVFPLVLNHDNLLQIPEIALDAWKNNPLLKTPIKPENNPDQKLENINQYIKTIALCGEFPKSAELKNKVKNEMMFEKIKNIYNVPNSNLALKSMKANSATAELKRNSIIKTLNAETTNK
jgi:hypothetical protein